MKCKCNGCEMAFVDGEWWCPHMGDDFRRHLIWQAVNQLPLWLCKYVLVK